MLKKVSLEIYSWSGEIERISWDKINITCHIKVLFGQKINDLLFVMKAQVLLEPLQLYFHRISHPINSGAFLA